MKSLRLYWKYARINTKGLLQYRLWPVQILTSLLNTVWDFFAIIVLYWRFGTLGEWQIGHTLFAFGLGATSFGLGEWFSRGLDMFPWYIRSGAFDRVLLRPQPTILQALGERFQLDRCGRVLVGIGCVVAAGRMLELSWSVSAVVMIVLAVVGGWFLYTGVFTIFATISFWTIGPIQLVYMFTNHLQIFFLFVFWQLFVEQKIGRFLNNSHGGTKFMGNHGNEFRFKLLYFLHIILYHNTFSLIKAFNWS